MATQELTNQPIDTNLAYDLESDRLIETLKREIRIANLKKVLEETKLKTRKLAMKNAILDQNYYNNINEDSDSTISPIDSATPAIKPDEKLISNKFSSKNKLNPIILRPDTEITTYLGARSYKPCNEIVHVIREECKITIYRHVVEAEQKHKFQLKYEILVPEGTKIINNGVTMKLQEDAWYFTNIFDYPDDPDCTDSMESMQSLW